MMFVLLGTNLYQPIAQSSNATNSIASIPYNQQSGSFPTINAINNNAFQTSVKGNESLGVTGPVNSTIKEIQIQNISMNSTNDYLKSGSGPWNSIGNFSAQKQTNNTDLNITISGTNDTVVFNPMNYNNSREAFIGLNTSKWNVHVNDSDASVWYEYPLIWSNNTSGSGAVLKKFETISLYGESKSCVIELQFPFQYNASYQYYSGGLSFWYSINFDQIANLTEGVNTSVFLSKPSSQNISIDGWNAQYESNGSGDVNWQFKNFSFNALNSVIDETGNYTLVFRTEISHVRNGTYTMPGITKFYLDEITFFMNFTAKQLRQNQTTGLLKQLSIDRVVQGNLTLSGFYFSNTLVSSTLYQNFSLFATIHNISLFIWNFSQNMLEPQPFAFQINFSTIASVFNISFFLVVRNPNPPLILPNESTSIQIFNLSLLANTLPTVSQINCSLMDSKTDIRRNLTLISESPARYQAILSFSSSPVLSNPGLQIIFLVNETNVQFNFTLNISYYSVQDTIFNQFYQIFDGLKRYLGTLNSFIGSIVYNETAVSAFEPYFKLLQQNRTLQALRTLYEQGVSDAYVIHHYLLYLQNIISLSKWYDYIFYDLGIEEFLSVRIRGINAALDDILFTIYSNIKSGRADVVPERLEKLYGLVSSLSMNFEALINGTSSTISLPNLALFPITPIKAANLLLLYCQNYTLFNTNSIILEFMNFESKTGIPSIFSAASEANGLTSREYLEISLGAGQLLSYLYMIYSIKTVDSAFIHLSNYLKSLYTTELIAIPSEPDAPIVNQWDVNYRNGILKSSLDVISNSTGLDSKASLTVFYPLESNFYCLGVHTFNITVLNASRYIEINLTLPETTYLLSMNNGNNRTIIPYLIKLTLFTDHGPITYWKNITAISNLTVFEVPLNLDNLQKINKTITLFDEYQNSTLNFTTFRANRLLFAFRQKILLPQFQREISYQTGLPLCVYSNQQLYLDSILLNQKNNSDLSIIIDSGIKDRFNDPIFIGTELSNIPVKYIISIPSGVDSFEISLNVSIQENQNILEMSIPIEFEYFYLDQEPPVYLNTLLFAMLLSSIIAGLSIVVIRVFKAVYLEYFIQKRNREAMDRF